MFSWFGIVACVLSLPLEGRARAVGRIRCRAAGEWLLREATLRAGASHLEYECLARERVLGGRRVREARFGVRVRSPLGVWILGRQAGLDGNRGEGWTSPGGRLAAPRLPSLSMGARGITGMSWTLCAPAGDVTTGMGRDGDGRRQARVHVRWGRLELGHSESAGARRWTAALNGSLGSLPVRLESELGDGGGFARLGCGGRRLPAGLICQWSGARGSPACWEAAVGLGVERGALAGSRFEILSARASHARLHWRWRWGNASHGGSAEWRRTAAGRRATTASAWTRVSLGRCLDARVAFDHRRAADGTVGVGGLIELRGRSKRWRWGMEVEMPPHRARREVLNLSGPVGEQRVALRLARGAQRITIEVEWRFTTDLAS